jgi:hypothetical protein
MDEQKNATPNAAGLTSDAHAMPSDGNVTPGATAERAGLTESELEDVVGGGLITGATTVVSMNTVIQPFSGGGGNDTVLAALTRMPRR